MTITRFVPVFSILAVGALTLSGCDNTNGPDELAAKTAPPSSTDHFPGERLSEQRYREHVRTLASDEFEGRAPSSPGEEKTVAYIAKVFESLGLAPGNGDSYFQDVPLVTMTATSKPIQIRQDGEVIQTMEIGPDAVTWTKRVTDSVSLSNSELVFVGYGIVAPEYGWNDYAGVDMNGKTAVIMVNDPGFATQDPELFRGNAMTYYGRWTYKYEEAARQGAAGAIILHETWPASYPWAVVQGSWTGPQHDLVTADKNAGRVKIESWISVEQARQLFSNAGLDYAAEKTAAATRGFVPKAMGLTASTSLTNDISVADSKNVLAVLPGTDQADEYFVFSGHWDHLGKDPSLEGDQIYNGAVDNATGTAGLLALAEAFTNAPTKPSRSILFLAVTAEESGLLGSKHYGENPVFPLARTIGGVNMDALSVQGRSKDVAVVGYGASELEDILREMAEVQERVIVPEPSPERGGFYRSDHFNLAKVGVPMLYAKSGNDLREGGRAAGSALVSDYIAKRYHKPSDEYSEDWDLTGTMEDLALFYAVADKVANMPGMIEWYDGTEFKAIREKSLAN